MLKPNTLDGGKNLVSARVKELREERGLSQSDLAQMLQLNGCDIDQNMITRIEKNIRCVTDMELKAFVEVFGVGYGYLIDGKEDTPVSQGEMR